MMIGLTRWVARTLGKASKLVGRKEAPHLTTARDGETEAYFHLRSLGYRIVARNFRVGGDHGEIDMIGWDEGILCFVEVKTHSKPGLVPPEVAVGRDKQEHIRSVARRYVKQLHASKAPVCRFDVVSVILGKGRNPEIRLQKGAFGWKTGRG